MKQCFACQSEKMAKKPILDELEVAGYKFTAHLEANFCESCGEYTFPSEEVERFEVAVALQLSEMGERSAEAFRFMRKAIDLKAQDLAQLLGTTPETISRWENDKVDVDPGAFVILGALVEEYRTGSQRTRARLLALRNPKRPKSDTIEVHL